MNKALHAFVYLFVAATAASLWFASQLSAKRTELRDRNRLQEDALMTIANMTETGYDKTDSEVAAKAELPLDVSPVEAKPISKDEAEHEDQLEAREYQAYLEKLDHQYMNWGEAQRQGLRRMYVLDAEGKPQLDGAQPQTRDSEEDILLKNLIKALGAQKERLKATREALPVLRERLEAVVAKYNDLAVEAREDKCTIVKRDTTITELETEKKRLEDEVVRIKAQIDELNSEISSLKDEVAASKEETEVVKDALAKSEKLIQHLKKLLQEALNRNNGTTNGSGAGAGQAVASVPFGDKGKLVRVDNEIMSAIVEFTPEAMAELKGADRSRPLPIMEFGVKREGFAGPAQNFVGRIRLRQEVPGHNYIICDILSNWSQAPLENGDIVFAE